mgnify:CR=1 FL=1
MTRLFTEFQVKRAILKEGDIISIDMGAILDGWHSDAARTFGVGKISDEAQNLIDVTRQKFLLRELKYVKHGAN